MHVWTVNVINDSDDTNASAREYEVVADSIQDAIRKAMDRHGVGYAICAERGKEVIT